jgi:hypothetical protein
MSDDKSPLFQRFGKSRLDDRKLDQLLGICEGVIADGTVNLHIPAHRDHPFRLNVTACSGRS